MATFDMPQRQRKNTHFYSIYVFNISITDSYYILIFSLQRDDPLKNRGF